MSANLRPHCEPSKFVIDTYISTCRFGSVGTRLLLCSVRDFPFPHALLTVVQEMGRLVGEPTPTIDVVLALVKMRERMALSGE